MTEQDRDEAMQELKEKIAGTLWGLLDKTKARFSDYTWEHMKDITTKDGIDLQGKVTYYYKLADTILALLKEAYGK